VNKRQRAKRRKRDFEAAKRTVEGFLRDALKKFVGKFADPEKVRAVIVDTLQKMTQYPAPLGPVYEATFVIMTKLYPPYRQWADERNVVHWTGMDRRDKYDLNGPYEDIALRRLCDNEEVDESRMVEPDEAITCIRCHAIAHDRMMR
jgi:hypothetical protein